MITIQSRVQVAQAKGKELSDFLLTPTDREYQRWWPGTHFEFHTIRKVPGDIGNVIYMDEFVGKRRIKMKGIVTEVIPDKRITWQLKQIVPLPVWLSVDFDDNVEGVAITHTIRAGFAGVGKLFDPILRLYFSAEFTDAMDEHVKVEFPRLGVITR